MAQLLWFVDRGDCETVDTFYFMFCMNTLFACVAATFTLCFSVSTHFHNFTKAYIRGYNFYQGNAC